MVREFPQGMVTVGAGQCNQFCGPQVMLVDPNSMNANAWKNANGMFIYQCVPVIAPVPMMPQAQWQTSRAAPQPFHHRTPEVPGHRMPAGSSVRQTNSASGQRAQAAPHACGPAKKQQQAQRARAEEEPWPEQQSPRAVKGRVWQLAKDPKGCRLLQHVFEDAECDDTRAELASELRTHVWEALKCPNANHVLQKCISTMRPLDLQFIIDEVMQAGAGAASKAARHRFGCRVLQRLLEHCSTEQTNRLAEELLLEATTLCTHLFGNYVMQHLCEHGTEDHIVRLTQVLTANIAVVCRDPHGSAVIEKCLGHAGPEAQVSLANALMMEPELLATMGSSRHGNRAAKLALAAADTEHRNAAIVTLMEQKDKLRTSRYGRVLATFVEKCMQEESEVSGSAAESSSLDGDDD